MNQSTSLNASLQGNNNTNTRSVLTRSRSRMVSSRQSLGANGPSSAKARRTIAPPSSSSSGVLQPTTSSTRPIVPLKGQSHHHHHGRTSSEVSKLEGMGIVRRGPPIVSPAKQQTTHHPRLSMSTSTSIGGGMSSSSSRSNLPAAMDPYSVDFRPTLPSSAASPGHSRPNNKRALELSPQAPTTLAPLQFTSPLESPAKKTHFSPSPSPSTRTGAGPFDMISPTKSHQKSRMGIEGGSARKMLLGGQSPAKEFQAGSNGSPNKVRKLLFHRDRDTGNDENATTSASSSMRMEVDNDLTPRAPRRKEKELEESSSEDEIDFLSPRKKLAMENERTLKRERERMSIRSPPAKASGSAPKVKRSSTVGVNLDRMMVENRGEETDMMGPTSVPMQRQSFKMPPPPPLSSTTATSTPARALPSYASYAPRPQEPEAPLTINPALLNQPIPAPTPSRLQQVATAPTPSRLGQSHPTPSGIPRLIRSRSSTISRPPPAPVAPQPQSQPIIQTQLAPPTIAEESDLSISSNTSTSTLSSISSAGSEETASRLAHLQAMLSRLAMPRNPALTNANSRDVSMEINEVPPIVQAGVGAVVGARKEVAARRRQSAATNSNSNAAVGTARFREEYSVPLKGDDEPPRPPAPTSTTTGKRKLERSRSFGGENGSGPVFGFGANSSQPNASSSRTSTAPSAGSSGKVTSMAAPTAAPRRISMLPSSSSTAPIGSVSSTEGSTGGSKSKILKGVVAYVDVRTSDGDDAGMIFVDMLKSMGARVTVRPSTTLTHIIFKSGRPGTLQRYRMIPDANKPFLIGISWVVRCAELEKRVDEKDFLVVDNKATAGSGGVGGGKSAGAQAKDLMAMHKRRRSMEPKAYAALNSSVGPSGSSSNADPTVKALIAASIERARRKSLQYAPKVGSPLAKRVFAMPTEDEEDERDEDEMRS